MDNIGYTGADNKYIKDNYGKIKSILIADKLGKSDEAIRMQAKRLGVSFNQSEAYKIKAKISFINDILNNFLDESDISDTTIKILNKASNLIFEAEESISISYKDGK